MIVAKTGEHEMEMKSGPFARRKAEDEAGFYMPRPCSLTQVLRTMLLYFVFEMQNCDSVFLVLYSQSSRLCLLNSGIRGVCHNTWLFVTSSRAFCATLVWVDIKPKTFHFSFYVRRPWKMLLLFVPQRKDEQMEIISYWISSKVSLELWHRESDHHEIGTQSSSHTLQR